MLFTRRFFIVGMFIFLTCFTTACSTRGIHDKYFGATEQRLMTRSIDQLIQKLPEKDFKPLYGQNVYPVCHFVEDNTALQYAQKRLELELMEKYHIHLIDSPETADAVLQVFFTAIGTDQDNFGFKTPDFIIPGSGTSVSIDLISLDMYHGVSEFYYYIIDQKSQRITRGDRLKSIIRTDKLALPIITIPINTLD